MFVTQAGMAFGTLFQRLSRMWHHAIWCIEIIVSEKLSAPIFKAEQSRSFALKQVPLKHWCLSTKLSGILPQMTVILSKHYISCSLWSGTEMHSGHYFVSLDLRPVNHISPICLRCLSHFEVDCCWKGLKYHVGSKMYYAVCWKNINLGKINLCLCQTVYRITLNIAQFCLLFVGCYLAASVV
jgi:hypothetical protein